MSQKNYAKKMMSQNYMSQKLNITKTLYHKNFTNHKTLHHFKTKFGGLSLGIFPLLRMANSHAVFHLLTGSMAKDTTQRCRSASAPWGLAVGLVMNAWAKSIAKNRKRKLQDWQTSYANAVAMIAVLATPVVTVITMDSWILNSDIF